MAPTTSQPSASWQRNAGMLAVVTVLIGVTNYAMSLAAAHLLPARNFADFAAGQGLLLVIGTGSFAAVPWAVARYLARSDDPQTARQAMHFAMTGSTVQAVLLAPVTFVIGWMLSGVALGISLGLAAAMICLLAGPVGFLQGLQKLREIALLRSLETIIRILATVGLIFAASRSAAWALLGFPIGTAVAVAYGLYHGRSGFPMRRPSREVIVALTKDAAQLGAIQVLLTMLGALDTVYADAGSFSATQNASYQAAALVARVPLFFSAAIATATYTGMAGARDETDVAVQLRGGLRTFTFLAVPFAVADLTIPDSMLHLVIPSQYAATTHVLRMLGLAGIAIGVINVITTVHQARARFASCLAILACAVVVQAGCLVGTGSTGNLMVFTAAELAVCVATVVALLWDARLWLGRMRHRGRIVRPALIVGFMAAVIAGVSPQPVFWVLAMLVVTAAAAISAVQAGRQAAGHAATSAPTRSAAPPTARPAPPARSLHPVRPVRHDSDIVRPRPRPRPRPMPFPLRETLEIQEAQR